VYLTDQLNDTTSFLDFALSLGGEVSCTNDERDFWNATLAENLGVAEGEEVKDWSGVGFLVGKVLLALLDWDKGPELWLLIVVQSILHKSN
jgi:hypothetical protein